MNRTQEQILLALFCGAISATLLAAGCSNASVARAIPHDSFHCVLHEGTYPNPDIVIITHTAGDELTDIRASLMLTGAKGDTAQVPIRLTTWKKNTEHTLTIPSESTVIDIQQIELNGQCDAGRIGVVWTFKTDPPPAPADREVATTPVPDTKKQSTSKGTQTPSGPRTCPICEGTGRKWCAPCAGEGWIHNFNDLAFPGANGRSTCAHCGGSGRAFCNHCSGTGTLK